LGTTKYGKCKPLFKRKFWKLCVQILQVTIPRFEIVHTVSYDYLNLLLLLVKNTIQKKIKSWWSCIQSIEELWNKCRKDRQVLSHLDCIAGYWLHDCNCSISLRTRPLCYILQYFYTEDSLVIFEIQSPRSLLFVYSFLFNLGN
jgi:hypothetical protein